MGKLKRAIKEIRDLRESDKIEENRRKYDEWFRSLSTIQKANMALNFWNNATLEDKQSQYSMRDF